MRLIVCLPGSNFSRRFVECWTNFLLYCKGANIEVIPSFAESSNVYHLRSQCLGADYRRGIHQKPFGGQVEHDYILWLDSDMVFEPLQVIRLITHKVPIVGGYYFAEGGKTLVCGSFNAGSMPMNLDEKTLLALPKANGLTEVGFNGFGFMLIKRGVFEAVEYPWFEPHFTTYDNVRDFSGEDTGFCIKARRKGFKILVDIAVKVGHEKRFVY